MQKDLKLLESELIPVYQTSTGEQVVYGTELHAVLKVKTKYTDWALKRFDECDAIENKDFQTCFSNLGSGNHGGQNKKEHIIQLDTAKEIAMLERNEIGKQVRKYFIEVEKKYKSTVIDLEQLDPQTQLMNLLVQSISQQELEQKRQAEQLKHIEQKQDAIIDTFQKTDNIKSFQKWVNDRITQIAESPKFDKGQGRSKNYSLARAESYERLKQKRNCRLNDRVQRAIGRALKEKPDIKKSELQKINKIYVIANDKNLKLAYELVIKEMMIAYCIAKEDN